VGWITKPNEKCSGISRTHIGPFSGPLTSALVSPGAVRPGTPEKLVKPGDTNSGLLRHSNFSGAGNPDSIMPNSKIRISFPRKPSFRVGTGARR